VIKSSRIIWVGHVTRIGRREMHAGFLWESQKEKRHKRRCEVNIRMDLKEIEWYGLDSSGSGCGSVAGSCKNGKEPSVPYNFSKIFSR
jgi:hypothetical protein